MQLRDLREFAGLRGWRIVREFVDQGISGTKADRPALNALMREARRRKFDIVACWRFDRLARSTKHLLLALEEFRSLGIQFVSFSENIDTTTPLGHAMFTIVAAVGQMERDIIAERVRAGLRNARAKGKVLGRPRRVVDVAQVALMRDSGAPWRAIAKELKIGLGTIFRAVGKQPSDSSPNHL